MDELMYNEFKTFAAHYNIPDLNKPYSVSGNLTLLSPATTTLSSYLADDIESDPNDPIYSKMKKVSLDA